MISGSAGYKIHFPKQPPLTALAPGDFAEKPVLKLVERFSGHCPAIKS